MAASLSRLLRYFKALLLAGFVTIIIVSFLGRKSFQIGFFQQIWVFNVFGNTTPSSPQTSPTTLIKLDSNVTTGLFPVKPFVIWSNDFHISPIADLKDILQPLGVKFIDKSLSGHCHVTGTCEGRKTLRVINTENAMDLSNPSLFTQFYESYKNDAEMLSVDAFVCFHPTSMCELFAQFNRTLIIIASTRYELGRFGKERWTRWNKNLVTYASIPGNIVGGNNLYDVEYIRYFTGLTNLHLLPSYCGYRSEKYSPSRPGFLLAPIHNAEFGNHFWKWYAESLRRQNINSSSSTPLLSSIRSLYPHYQYTDLTAHPGIVYVPYQVSVMSMFEQYRMNIPLWFPSVRLLADWQHQYMVRTRIYIIIMYRLLEISRGS